VTELVTAGAGFLLAVLWFDLMFDIQVTRQREDEQLPEEVLASIAGYYRRVTTDARPMNLLVGTVMLGLLLAIIVQLAQDETPNWVARISLLLAGAAIALAAAHTFRAAVRLGSRRDPPEVQSRLARSILRDHLLCFPAIVWVLVLQVAYA
jgi:RsiW-degrading membrane proteinase PrsW (M82 family)